MLSRKTELRLRDIIEDGLRIASFIDGMTLSDFIANERTIFAVERLLQRITEAAIQIDSQEAADFCDPLPIPQMRALGNRLRHEYRDIDRPTVFQIASVEVPAIIVSAELALEQ